MEEVWNRLIKSGDIYLDKVVDGILYQTKHITMREKSRKKGKKAAKVSGSPVDWVEEGLTF